MNKNPGNKKFNPVSRIIVILLIIAFLPAAGQSVDPYADSLLRVISEMPENTAKVDQVIRLARYHYRIDHDSALLYCDIADEMADKIKYPDGMADAMYIRSLVFKHRSELARSQECLDTFLEISTRIGDSIRLAKGYHQQGNLLEDLGDFESSYLFFEKSLAVYLPLKDTHAIVANYNSIANYFQSKTEFDSASFYYMKAIRLTEKQQDNRKLSILYRNLGDNYLLALQLETARNYFNRSLELCMELPHSDREIAHNYNCLAMVSAKEEKYDEALAYYKLAEDYFIKANYERGLIHVDNNYGDLYFRMKDYEKAIRYFDKVISQYRKLGYQNEFARALENKAVTLSEMGHYAKSMRLHDSTLKISTDLGNRELRMDILGNIADLYESMGQYTRSNEFLKRYYALKDSIFDLEKTKVVNELKLKYEKEKDQAQIIMMEKENLEKDISLDRSIRQRNAFLFGGLVALMFIVFLYLFLNQRIRKNRTIAEQRIRQLEEEKKLLAAQSIVEGQEEERKRIAKELHDGLGVLLSSAKMHFTSIRDKSPEASTMIDKATNLLEQATGDVRRISHNMMPGLLTKFGFFEAVEEIFEQVDEMNGMHTEVIISGEQTRLSENTEIMLYRIIQEMVNNSLKHAGASHLKLNISLDNKRLSIQYSDDGKGFDFEEKIKLRSMGLTGIQSRVKFLGGELNASTGEGKGLIYSFEISV